MKARHRPRQALLAAFIFFPSAAQAGQPAADWERIADSWASQTGLPKPDPRSQAQPKPVEGKPVLALRGFFSLWRQDCAPDCGLPFPVVKNDLVELALQLPEKPGEFRAARVEREYRVSGRVLRVQAVFYALCPREPAGTACPARYFQARVELSGAVAALCAASLNEADAAPFPVLACGAPLASNRGRLGVSLHRAPL